MQRRYFLRHCLVESSQYFVSQIVSISSVFIRHVKGFAFLSPYTPFSFLQCAQIRFSLSHFIKILALNSPSSVVHVIQIHGISDKNHSVLYGMSALPALQVVVTAISCGFYRCELTPLPCVSALPNVMEAVSLDKEEGKGYDNEDDILSERTILCVASAAPRLLNS